MARSNNLNWIIAIIGAWQIVSPFVLGYTTLPVAMWSAIITGAVILIVSLAAALINSRSLDRILDWVNFLLGIWLIISPFVLVFSHFGAMAAIWDAIVVGILVILLSLWAATSIGRREVV